MREIGRYDTEMQQFVEAPRPVNMERLLFQRWLVDNGRGEHMPYSRPAGDLALAVAIQMDTLPTPAVRRRTIVPGD